MVPTTARGQLLTLDIEYVTWANPESQLVYFPVEGCCGGGAEAATDGPDVVETGDADGRDTFPQMDEIGGLDDDDESAPEGDVGGCAPVARSPKEVRLGLLFLTRGDTHHPAAWEKYIASGRGRINAFCHAKRPEEITQGPLAGRLIEEQHETGWGDVSLLRAMAALLGAGLAEEELTHFMFLSESCVPIRKPEELLEVLALDGRSRFGLMDAVEVEQWQPAKARRMVAAPQIPRDRWRFHSQWTLLEREAARKILSVNTIEQFDGVFAADESWAGTSLMLGGWDLARKVVGRNPTWCRWREGQAHPVLIENVTPRLMAEWKTSGCFFARKVAPGAMDALVGSHGAVFEC